MILPVHVSLQGGILKVLKILTLPVEKDLRVLGPDVKHGLPEGLLAFPQFKHDEGVQNVVLTVAYVLAKEFRVLKEHSSHLFLLKAELGGEHHLGWHFDHHLILPYVLCGQHPRVLSIAFAKHDWVLHLWMLDSVSITPFEESLELLLSNRVCPLLKIVFLCILSWLMYPFHCVEKAQKGEFDLTVHV